MKFQELAPLGDSGQALPPRGNRERAPPPRELREEKSAGSTASRGPEASSATSE